MRTGSQYKERLRDGRTVYLDGERITNAVDHPAFRQAIETVATLYDFQASALRATCPSRSVGSRSRRLS